MPRIRLALLVTLLALGAQAQAQELGFLSSTMYCKDAYVELKEQWESAPQDARARLAAEMQSMAESCQTQHERNQLTAQKEKEDAAAKAKRAALPGARIGMTALTVRTKTQWGEPESVNRTTTQSGTREQWVYGDGQYLYFTNGRLTAIQN